jgi:hypothetical protein
VFALLVPSSQQVWNKLLTTCNNLVDTIRLVARLFQHVRYCCYIVTVSDLLEQPCNKLGLIIMPSSVLQVVNSLLQQLGTSSANTTCRQLVNRFVTITTCAFLRARSFTRKNLTTCQEDVFTKDL